MGRALFNNLIIFSLCCLRNCLAGELVSHPADWQQNSGASGGLVLSHQQAVVPSPRSKEGSLFYLCIYFPEALKKVVIALTRWLLFRARLWPQSPEMLVMHRKSMSWNSKRMHLVSFSKWLIYTILPGGLIFNSISTHFYPRFWFGRDEQYPPASKEY